MNDPPHLTLAVLGSVRASVGDADLVLAKRKARALLAYLALTDGRQETRERLGGLLWSEVTEMRARTSLRQEVHQLDELLRAAGHGGLRRDRQRVALAGAVGEIDCMALLDAVREGRIPRRLTTETLISDSFLRDVDDVDPAFAIWARARRQTFHDQLLSALETILRGAGAERARRRQCAQAILNLDPTHEEACRVFMRLSAEAGDPMAAQRAYNVLYGLLERDYDAEPAAETIALIAAIKQGHIGTVADDAPAMDEAGRGGGPGGGIVRTPRPWRAARTRFALLVEPFGMNGIAPDNQHLVDGFRHELLACLARFREWVIVAGRTPPDAKAMARLGLAGCFAIAATAYRAGEAISMVLTLREAESGLHLWGDRYALTLDTWFDAQQDIVRRIAVALDVEVSAARLARVADQPVVSLAAYDLWLRGQAVLLRFDRARWDGGMALYQEAIARAPNFAGGHSGLAQMLAASPIVRPGDAMTPDAARQALALANRAVTLDPMDPRSHLALGWSLAMARRFRAALVPLDLARELNPNDSWVQVAAALCQALCGDVAPARRLADATRRMTLALSRLHWGCLALIVFLAGDDAAAIDAADRAEAVMAVIVGWQAAALARTGQTSRAREAAWRCIDLARLHWTGPDAPTPERIGRWLLEMFPMADTSLWTRLRDGLAAAGIPAGDSRPG